MSEPIAYTGDLGIVKDDGNNKSGLSEKASVFLKILIVFLLLCLLGQLCYYIFIIPAHSVPRFVVSGKETVTSDEIVDMAGVEASAPWSEIDILQINRNLSLYPVFESVNVKKVFPDTISIDVVERKTAVMALISMAGRSVPVHIDRNGVIFKIGNDMDMDGAFFISGLNLENARVGDRISPELKNILSSLSELQEKYPELCSLISEVKIEKRDYGDYELVLYPVYTPIPVRTKGILTERVLRYVILVLDIVEGFDIKIEELDFRSGTVAYRSKEGR